MKQNGLDLNTEKVGSNCDDEEDYWRGCEEELVPLLRAASTTDIPEDPSYFRNFHKNIMTAIVESSFREESEIARVVDRSSKSRILRKNETSKNVAN